MRQHVYFSAQGSLLDLPFRTGIMAPMNTVRSSSRDAPWLGNRLFFRMYQCANMLHKTGTRALDDHGITTQQWAVLGALTRPAFADGVAVGDLADFLLVSRQNLTAVLRRLEAMNYVERSVDRDDQRSRLIRLTPKGNDLWREGMVPAIADFYHDALRGFSSEDQIHMIHYLDKMLNNFKAIDLDRPGSAAADPAGQD